MIKAKSLDIWEMNFNLLDRFIEKEKKENIKNEIKKLIDEEEKAYIKYNELYLKTENIVFKEIAEQELRHAEKLKEMFW